ncbi:MAG: DMT family transporter [Actinobacteria bacterium]|nr:DMT family transporter [Actinomycetota bacterium]
MTAVVLGLMTALLWAVSTVSSSRSVRLLSQYSVVAWAMIIGLTLTLPFALATGVPPELSGSNLVWFALAGAGNVVGLLIAYAALKVGKVGLVAPIIACEGAVAAVVSALLGESIAPLVVLALGIIVIGVVVSSVAPDPAPIEHEQPVRAVVLATFAAVVFGLGLFATGHLSGELPVSWLLLPPRIGGVVVLAIPLLLAGRLRMNRAALPYVVTTAFAEVLGFLAYAFAARDSVAVASVLASQFATFAAVIAYLVYRERLGRLQILGVALVVGGVAWLALLQA